MLLFFLEIYIFLLVFLFHSHLFLNAILLKYFVEILKYLLFYQLFYCQLSYQLRLQFFELLFLRHFLLHLLRISEQYQEVFDYTLIAHVFRNFSCMCTNIIRKMINSLAFYTSLGSIEYLNFIMAILFNY